MAFFKHSRYVIVLYLLSLYVAVFDLSSFCKAAQFSLTADDSLFESPSDMATDFLQSKFMYPEDPEIDEERIPILLPKSVTKIANEKKAATSGSMQKNALALGGIALLCILIGSVVHYMMKPASPAAIDYEAKLAELREANDELKESLVQWLKQEKPTFDEQHFEGVWEGTRKNVPYLSVAAFMKAAPYPLNKLNLNEYQMNKRINDYVANCDYYVYSQSLGVFSSIQEKVVNNARNMFDLNAFNVHRDDTVNFRALSEQIKHIKKNGGDKDVIATLEFFLQNAEKFVARIVRVRNISLELQQHLEATGTKRK